MGVFVIKLEGASGSAPFFILLDSAERSGARGKAINLNSEMLEIGDK